MAPLIERGGANAYKHRQDLVHSESTHYWRQRRRASRTSDRHLEVKLSVPGTAGTGTNPEQLFAVGWSACYLLAIKLDAAKMRLRLPTDVAVDSEIDQGTTNGGYLIQARLTVHLPGIDRDTAQKIVDAAKLERPYSKATHGNINVETNVETALTNAE